MEIILDNSWASVSFNEVEIESGFSKVALKAIDDKLKVRQKGYMFNPAFKGGHWDGFISFYDFKENRYPTGLTSKVEEALGELQTQYPFTYEIIDDRPDVLINPEDVPDEVILYDDEIDEISLRDYQMKAYKSALQNRMSVLHLATAAGKCIHPETNLLTSEGIMTLQDFFEENGYTLSDEEVDIEYNGDISLVNRYGELEKPSHLTFNGNRETRHITTDYGVEQKVTNNHPLLTPTKDGTFEWTKSEDLQVGDWIIGRKGTNIFGSDTGITPEDAYALGLLIADGYIARDDRIDFNNDQEELLDFMEDYFSKSWDYVSRAKDNRNKNQTVLVHGRGKVKEFKDTFGLGSAKSSEKEVPRKVLRGTKEVQIAFLSGYLECEMYINSTSKMNIEVTSASKKLITQVHQMLLNLGIHGRLKTKKVKNHEDNYYGRITFNRTESGKLLEILKFKTEGCNGKKEEFKENSGKKRVRFNQEPVPYGKELVEKYVSTYIGDSKGLSKKYHVPKSISVQRMRRLLEDYPHGDPTLKKRMGGLVSGEYLFHQITEIKDLEPVPTFDVSMPETNSFIGNGVINHNTIVAAGVIKTLLPELYAGETIAFFTESTEIFNQTAKVLEERLGIKVGKYGAGKKDIRDVNVVMVPTISAALKIDPEKGLRFSAKEMVVKKMAKEIAPQYLKGVNQRSLLKIYMHNFEVKTKADERLLQELDKVVYESGTDAEVKMKLNGYVVEYEKLVEKKNGKKLKKKKEVMEFLHSIVAFISDEHHHVVADSTYNTLLNCENAIYRIGLTGSIDYEDHLLTQRMWATTGAVEARVTTKELVDLGFVAQPKIVMAPVYTTKVKQQNMDITALKDYQKAYDLGIMQNEYRNELIAGITKMRYDDDMGVLIIVSRIEHGDSISELLDGYGVPHEFLQGEVDGDTRTEKLQEMRDGQLKVMIATTIMDEGVDISGIDVLILAAGGKSLRQTIQRVGRAIRKKVGRENTAYVYDFYDRTNEFLFKHSKERLKIYEEEEFEINYIE